ncbi:MAG TPA: FAD-dependent monooxygenase [Coriobacteriia bacterium]|nr:FAD-dependent monooxygenase [Coriobacteriia bacterium]
MDQPGNGRSTEYDTVVAGAGPAGVAAAMAAADRGSVLLLEASDLPRDKSCGGMLNDYARDFLAAVAPLPASMVREPEYVNFRYVDWDRAIRKATSLRFLNVDRRAFDDWLVSLLPDAVDVVGGCSVSGFEQDADGVTVTVKSADGTSAVRCANLIGADGARSTVRRTLGEGSVSTYVTLQDFCELRGEIEPYFDCIYMRGIGDSYAYSYVVPKGDVALVGSVYYPKTKRPHEKQELTMAALRSALPQIGATMKREASVALHVRSGADVVPGRGRVLLAGEAGGFMSPTSGEGISYALNSGAAAGVAVATSSPEDALAAYTQAVEPVAANIRRKLKWLPLMESSWGKYLAGFVPTPIVSKVTEGL